MIHIENEIYNKLTKLHKENCGFIWGKGIYINNIFKVKNISQEFNEFKMKKNNVFYFLFRNFIRFLFTDFNLIIYHVHSWNGRLSEKDKKNMIAGLIYIIVYKNELFLYRKNKKQIESLEYKTYKEES